MELRFKVIKDEITGLEQIIPYTEDGQLVENCVACCVESAPGVFTKMTITIEDVKEISDEESIG